MNRIFNLFQTRKKNPVHQTGYFKLENCKNQVQGVGCNWDPPNTYLNNQEVLCPFLSEVHDQTNVFQVYSCSELAVIVEELGDPMLFKRPHIFEQSHHWPTNYFWTWILNVDQHALRPCVHVGPEVCSEQAVSNSLAEALLEAQAVSTWKGL